MAGVNEAALIERILRGERNAYAELVRLHQARILRLCCALLHDSSLAEDAAQEVFLKAYQRLSSFRGASSFGTWLYRIASNHCLDLLRKQKRQPTEPLDAIAEMAADTPPNTADKELVQQALVRLSPEYRLILTLREVEGLSYAELAEALHCSLDAVKARLRRSRLEFLAQMRHFSASGSV